MYLNRVREINVFEYKINTFLFNLEHLIRNFKDNHFLEKCSYYNSSIKISTKI